MNKYARDLWIRALDALHTARVDISVSYDATASRAYLLQLRDTGDYGGSQHVMEDDPKTVFAIANEVEAIGSIGLVPGKDVHCFTAELGYWLAEPYTTNTASARVLEKAGFKYEGLLRASAFKNERLVDQLLYAPVNA